VVEKLLLMWLFRWPISRSFCPLLAQFLCVSKVFLVPGIMFQGLPADCQVLNALRFLYEEFLDVTPSF